LKAKIILNTRTNSFVQLEVQEFINTHDHISPTALHAEWQGFHI
jgi:hypothetical protein